MHGECMKRDRTLLKILKWRDESNPAKTHMLNEKIKLHPIQLILNLRPLTLSGISYRVYKWLHISESWFWLFIIEIFHWIHHLATATNKGAHSRESTKTQNEIKKNKKLTQKEEQINIKSKLNSLCYKMEPIVIK